MPKRRRIQVHAWRRGELDGGETVGGRARLRAERRQRTGHQILDGHRYASHERSSSRSDRFSLRLAVACDRATSLLVTMAAGDGERIG